MKSCSLHTAAGIVLRCCCGAGSDQSVFCLALTCLGLAGFTSSTLLVFILVFISCLCWRTALSLGPSQVVSLLGFRMTGMSLTPCSGSGSTASPACRGDTTSSIYHLWNEYSMGAGVGRVTANTLLVSSVRGAASGPFSWLFPACFKGKTTYLLTRSMIKQLTLASNKTVWHKWHKTIENDNYMFDNSSLTLAFNHFLASWAWVGSKISCNILDKLEVKHSV